MPKFKDIDSGEVFKLIGDWKEDRLFIKLKYDDSSAVQYIHSYLFEFHPDDEVEIVDIEYKGLRSFVSDGFDIIGQQGSFDGVDHFPKA